MAQEGNGLAIVAAIRDTGVRLAGCNAAADTFDIRATLESLNLGSPVVLFLNWYRFDTLDVIAASELALRFSGIWYPSADDIELFDSSCEWFLSIAHTGDVSLTTSLSVQ